MKLTKPLLRQFRTVLERHLQAAAEELGVSISLGNARYSAAQATFKFDINTIGEDGEVFDKYAEDFKTYAKLFDLEPEHLGKEFYANRDRYVITGLNMRAKKFPVLAKSLNSGKTYKFAADIVKFRIMQQAAARSQS